MSRLKVYWPDEVHAYGSDFGGDEPAILSFPLAATKPAVRPSRFASVLERARVLRDNAVCPHCDYPIVEPIELQDAATSRGNLPIPGTATLVGFRCSCCEAEWPV